MEKLSRHAVKTVLALFLCAFTAVSVCIEEALAALLIEPEAGRVDLPAIGRAPVVDGMGRFAGSPPDNEDGAPALQPSGRATRLFRSIIEVGSGFPSTLCELIENSLSGSSSARLSIGTGAGFSELLSDESRVVGTGLGYDLGTGLRVQGFGVFDMDENSAYAGPALTYNLQDSIDLTTGVQVPLNEDVSERQDFFFAEIRVLF